MTKLNLFVPMVKYDAESNVGYGVLAEEAVDKSKEIFDYESSKPLFAEWSDAFKKVTDGASAGNLRAMHGKTAAGKFLDVSFDDTTKTIPVSFKVVDPVDQAKCAEGVYTGLSIGGEYVKRWPVDKDGVTRYTAKPVEGSLVDNPCMYGATFAYVKAAGAEPELRKFKGTAEPEKSPLERGVAYLMKALSPASLLSIVGATVPVAKAEEPPVAAAPVKVDPPVVEEDIELKTAKGIRAAFDRAMKPDAGKVIGEKNLIKLQRLIVKAWKEKLDPKATAEAQKEAIEGGLIKGGWYCVSSLASSLASLEWTLSDLEMADSSSPALGMLQAAAKALADAVVALAGEAAGSGEIMEAAAKPAVTKADEPKFIPALDEGAVTKAFETVVKAQAEATAKDLEKRIAKTLGESVEPLKKSVEEVRDAVAKVDERLKKVERTPAEAGSPVKVADKTFGAAGANDFAGLDLATAMKVVEEVTKGGASEASVREMKLALAARMMPH